MRGLQACAITIKVSLVWSRVLTCLRLMPWGLLREAGLGWRGRSGCCTHRLSRLRKHGGQSHPAQVKDGSQTAVLLRRHLKIQLMWKFLDACRWRRKRTRNLKLQQTAPSTKPFFTDAAYSARGSDLLGS